MNALVVGWHASDQSPMVWAGVDADSVAKAGKKRLIGRGNNEGCSDHA
jgi:hypothetical protein